MPRDAQTATAGVTAGTEARYIQLEGGGIAQFPASRMVFHGSFGLDGSGVGDTADCQLTLPLPDGVVWQLDQWAVTIATSEDYNEGIFQQTFKPYSGSGISTTIDHPIIRCRSNNPSQVAGALVCGYALGGQVVSSLGVNLNALSDGFDPFRVISYNNADVADPVVWLSSGTGTQATAGTLMFYITYLGYTFEQMEMAWLHSGLNTRG